PDNAKARQLVVLKAMQKEGHLTAAEVDKIGKEPLAYQPHQALETHAPYFRDYVKSVAIHRHGLSKELVESGGLSIYTTLDLALQKQAEQAIAERIDSGSDLQAALVAVDRKNGAIKAMVGGTDYETSEYNRAYAKR